MHHFRPCEGFGEEDRVRGRALDLVDDPFPERERLGMWIVHPEDPDSLSDPEGAPVVGLEIERIDVLVLLGRVLRILDAAIRTMLEPVRVRAHVRVIGRALERDVEGDLQS